MVKKEEYKLSVDGQKEVTFVNGVVDTAKKTAIVAAHAVESTNGKYDPAKVEQFQNDLFRVAEKYEGNLVVLEQTRADLETSRKQVVEYHGTSGKLRERVAEKVEQVKTLEGRLDEAVNTVGVLASERDKLLLKYGSEKDQRKVYEAELDRANRSLNAVSGDLTSTKSVLSATLSQVDSLSKRTNTRTSAVQALLQTYFGVPESTFKGVAEDKKEEHVYKLLEEQLSARAAKDKKVEEELNSALGGNVKTEKTSETNGQKSVNRVKVAAKSGNGK